MSVHLSPISSVAAFNPSPPKSAFSGTHDVAFVPMAAVSEDGSMQVREHKSGSTLSNGYSYFQTGDVLVAKITPCFENNKITVAEIDREHGFGSTEFHVIRPSSSDLDARYLAYFLRQDSVRDLGQKRMTGSAGQRRVPRQFLEQLEIPLPPLDEQRRIAAILDQADALRRKRRDILRQTDLFARSLFVDMFGNPVSNDRKWETQPLAHLTTKVGSGATPTGGDSAYRETGIPFVRSMNVRDGRFLPDGLAHIDEIQAKKLDNVIVQENDVLLNITGASVARVCRAPRLVAGGRVNQHVSIVRPNARLDACFLEAALLHQSAKEKLLLIGESGATRQAITKAQIERYEMIVPPPDLQRRFQQTVQTVQRLSGFNAAQLGQFELLFASLQHRAFRGEL